MSNMELSAMRVLVAAMVLIGCLPVCKSNPVEDSKEIASSCDVEFFEGFAIVTCNFSVDVYVEKRKFHLEYIANDATTKGPEVMIACFWTDGRVGCRGDTGYELYMEDFNHVLKFKVNLTHAKSGYYTCKIPNQSYAVKCCGTESSLKDKTIDTFPAASLSTWQMGLIIGGVAIFCSLITAVVCYCTQCPRQQETGVRDGDNTSEGQCCRIGPIVCCTGNVQTQELSNRSRNAVEEDVDAALLRDTSTNMELHSTIRTESQSVSRASATPINEQNEKDRVPDGTATPEEVCNASDVGGDTKSAKRMCRGTFDQNASTNESPNQSESTEQSPPPYSMHPPEKQVDQPATTVPVLPEINDKYGDLAKTESTSSFSLSRW